MDIDSAEFQDWEVLHNSESDSVENMKITEGIEGDSDSEGIIKSDYFSLDSQNKYSRADVTEEGSVESDNPSWIDPGSVTRSPRKESTEFWSDSSSDRSEDRKFGQSVAKNEMGIIEIANIQVASDGTGEIVDESQNSGKFWSESGGIDSTSMKFTDLVEKPEMGVGDNAYLRDGSEFSGEEKEGGGEKQGSENGNAAIEAMKSGGGEEKRCMVWWKLPLELLKYCVFKASPVWTVSMAAAVMGIVILGRRLYKMKRKTRSLPLKVTVDDKKISQFMSRAARLNEAFSVVKRVPIIRPALPAAGVTPWPVMSMR